MSDRCRPARAFFGSGLVPWLTVFVATNVFDWLLTWILVNYGNGYEANPVAARILETQGWPGLACFKGVSVVVALGVTLVLHWRHPPAARRLLYFECAIMLLVVAYSSMLIRQDLGADQRLLAEEKERAQRIERRQQGCKAYQAKVEELATGIAAGKLDLLQATEKLADFLPRSGHDPRAYISRVCAGLDLQGCLSAHLLRQTGFVLRHQPGIARRLLPHWRQQFVMCYSYVPEFALHYFPGWPGYKDLGALGY
jgi:hypothetical protein